MLGLVLPTLAEERNMNDTTAELKQEIHKSLGLMRTLRDEIRVKVHLAGMDAKTEWQKLEPKAAEVERAAHELTDATRKSLSEVVGHLKTLRSSLL
jgi:hypothetical protein